jgi:hypothetical protein
MLEADSRPMHYSPPTPADLRCLKEELGMTGVEMAELFGLAGGQQWRKYTGGQSPRGMGLHMLFFAAARLVLTPEELEKVASRMQAAGAQIKLDAAPGPQAGQQAAPATPPTLAAQLAMIACTAD